MWTKFQLKPLILDPNRDIYVNYAYWVVGTCFELRVLSGIASKSTIIGPNCAGPSFERLSFEMSKDSLSKDSLALVGNMLYTMAYVVLLGFIFSSLIAKSGSI